ncbi:MAG: tRNA 2-selenouridine(34) synthase MnmH [Bacteroidetes bacterium]|nr:tRNA 2-selenouridine(34) synthase MnmH [Bacteroidota bacterium]
MAKAYQIKDFLVHAETLPVIDVRSEGEFLQGHIPGAISVPLFTNAERAAVGTIYKQESKELAVQKGLEIVGPKLTSFVQQVKSHISGKEVLVHCWRGGMRSGSFAWLLETSGLTAGTLIKGYKAYRNYVLSSFTNPLKLILLGGKTGSGKTKILHYLKEQGEQVIDLEELCSHKGSAFGAIGQKPQCSSEQFENNLSEILLRLDSNKRIWIEDESRNLGNIYIPESFW